MSKTIAIRCSGADTIAIDDLRAFQGSIKKLSNKNLSSLKLRIVSDGFIAPIFIWNNEDNKMILDGHQRLSALTSLQRDGWDIPPIPVVYVDANDEEEARRMLLSIASQYGEWQKEELDIWLNDIDASIVETLRLVDESILENKDDKDQKTKTINYDSKIELIVTLQNEIEAEDLYTELTGRAMVCRISTL